VLFPGDKQEARFGHLLHQVLNNLTDSDEMHLGAKPKDVGTHSIRKGAITFCTGMAGGPSISCIYLRAGWSFGDTQDRYIVSTIGGDQFTGRVVCGLPNTTMEFRTLPPHFQDKMPAIPLATWKEILPNYEYYPVGFKQTLIYLLGSIVYHRKWLEDYLGPS